MENKLGNRIISLRKAKNMTQETLARELGVSAPAISKWETGSSLPDVSMLCPLARALDTDLNTLFCFEETLSEEALRTVGAEFRDMIYSGMGYDAEKELDELLKKYPSDTLLKVSAISVYNLLLSTIVDATDEEKSRWNRAKKELAQWIYDNGAPAYHKVAVSMLIAATLEENDLDRAENLLQEAEKTPADYMDFIMLRVSLHLKKGEKDLAMQALMRQQTLSAGKLLNAMMGMLRADMEPDKERIMTLCEQMQVIENMFGIENPSYAFIYVESYLRAGEYEKALDYLEKALLNSGPEMKPIILRLLSLDESFEPLRGKPRFTTLMNTLKSN